MRGAKTAGLIARFPNGRRAKGLPPLSKNVRIRKAQRIIEVKMAAIEKVPTAVPDKAWDQLTNAEQLRALARSALGTARDVLALGVDPSDPRVLRIVTDTALTMISQQIRVEERQPRGHVEVSPVPGTVRIILSPDDPLLAAIPAEEDSEEVVGHTEPSK